MKLSREFWLALVILVMLSCVGIYKFCNSRNSQLIGTIVCRKDTENKIVALTFDDGPTNKTDLVLDILEHYGVKATFFLTGNEMNRAPEQLDRIVAAGHSIGNHSYSHKSLMFKAPGFIRNEVEATDKIIRESGFQKKIFFRPPYCKKLFYLPWYLYRTNRTTVTWDIEPDSKGGKNLTSEKIIENVKQNIKPGSVILLHAMYKSRETSLGALPGIIEWLQKDGYTLVTVNEMFGDK
jgi:peptidoglycan-N-acetylglucosamine deacetylase